MWTIALISCGARKLDHPAPARDLYTGTLFRYARAWVEEKGRPWHILSARHGLVDPDQLHEPCSTVPLRQIQDILRQLHKDKMVRSKQRATITDGRNHRSWDYATRHWPIPNP